jgi:hypothetical protein
MEAEGVDGLNAGKLGRGRAVASKTGIKVKKNLLTEILFALQPSHVQCQYCFTGGGF